MFTEDEINSAIVKVLRQDRSKSIEPDNWFHCSGAAACRRQLWNAKRCPVTFDDKSVRAMGVGTILHNWLEHNVYLEGTQREVSVAKQYGNIVVIGRTDMIDKDTVYDWKTIRALWYLPTEDGKGTPKTFKEGHVPQLNLYADMLGKENICLLYVDKGDIQVKAFPMKVDKNVVNNCLRKFKDVYGKLNYDKNPFPLCGCFQCEEERLIHYRNATTEEEKAAWEMDKWPIHKSIRAKETAKWNADRGRGKTETKKWNDSWKPVTGAESTSTVE